MKVSDGFIDAISLTFKPARIDVPALVSVVRHWIGDFPYAQRKSGANGFKHSVDLPGLGLICYGGDQQKGRVLIQLLGTACARVKDWAGVVRWIHAMDARITRLDLTVDIVDGKAYSVNQAVYDYREKKFGVGGRMPKVECRGDWVNNKSRTFYVGAIESGKLLRVYEKGHQLKSEKWPNWVRVELELHKKDRDIPRAAILQPLPFLAGAYPALNWLHDFNQGISTHREICDRTLKTVLANARNQAGLAANAALLHVEGDKARAFDLLHRSGLPARLVGFQSIAESELTQEGN